MTRRFALPLLLLSLAAWAPAPGVALAACTAKTFAGDATHAYYFVTGTTSTCGSTAIALPTQYIGPAGYSETGPLYSIDGSLSTHFKDVVQKPVVTNQWWTGLISKPNVENIWSGINYDTGYMFADPLVYLSHTDGLELGTPSGVVVTGGTTPSYLMTPPQVGHAPLRVSLAGLSGSTAKSRVWDYSDWGVTTEWTQGASALWGTMLRGHPVAYFETEGDASVRLYLPNYQPNVAIDYLEDAHLTAILITDLNGHRYLAFFPQGTTVATHGAPSPLGDRDPHYLIPISQQTEQLFYPTITLPAAASFFSVMAVPPSVTDNLATLVANYRNSAFSFVTGTTVSWAYTKENARVATTYHFATTVKQAPATGAATLHTALYPAQKRHLSPTLTALGTYATPYGAMSLISVPAATGGHSFTTHLAFGGVLPTLPLPATAGNLARLKDLYANHEAAFHSSDPASLGLGPDAYWSGKTMAKFTELALIARMLGKQADSANALSQIVGKMKDWANTATPSFLYFFAPYNTLFSHAQSYGSSTGSNDHVFGYGYIIRTAALLTMLSHMPNSGLTADEVSFITSASFKTMIELMIKDVANWTRETVSDSAPTFAYLKSFDPYLGVMWAKGLPDPTGGTNTESSTEAVNFDHAVIMWGEATGQSAIRDLGVYLYAHDTLGALTCRWNAGGDVPAEFATLMITQGVFPSNLWSKGGQYATFFTGYELNNPTTQTDYGINLLPMGGGSFFLGRRAAAIFADYKKAAQYAAANSWPNQNDVWTDIFGSLQAMSDPGGAKAYFNATVFPSIPAKLEMGNTLSNTWRYISFFDENGATQTPDNATAGAAAAGNHALSTVLVKNGLKTYVAYNASATALPAGAVKFFDATTLATLHTNGAAIAPWSFYVSGAGAGAKVVPAHWIMHNGVPEE